MEEDLFTPISSITSSIEASFKNYTLETTNLDWTCPENSIIKEIRYNNKIFRAKDYVLEKKISKRGRKPKIKKESESISSLSFILRKEKHRNIKKDTYSKTSSLCKEHNSCEIIYKDYTILVFSGGKIVSVGIIEKDCEDFYWCLNVLTEFLIKKGLKKEDLEIININKTLENFKFELKDKEKRIKLNELNNFFVQKFISGEILNIELDKLFNFLIKNIYEEKKDLCEKTDIDIFLHNTEIKKFLIIKEDFLNILEKINFKEWREEAVGFYKKIREENINNLTYKLDKQLEKVSFESFIKSKIQFLLNNLPKKNHNIVETISITDEKNTLMLVKKINGKGVTVKVFTSGKIDILGSKGLKHIETVYNDIQKVFKENPHIIFHPDNY